MRPCLVGLGGFGGAAFISAFAARGRAVPCAGARDRGHPPGRLRRHLRCAGKLRRAGKKQEILKDPRCGAFAVIRLCTYFTAYLGLCAAVDCTPRAALCMELGFVLERALSGYAIAAFPLAKNTGLAHTFATGADRTAVRRALLALCALAAAGMAAAGGMTGAAMALAAVLVFCDTARWRKSSSAAYRATWPDGFAKAELWMLAALAACSLLSGVTG